MTNRWHDPGDQDGLIASQLAIVMPAVLLLIMLSVQYGLWAHSQQLVSAAADIAVTAAAVPDGTADDATAAARSYLAGAGNVTGLTVNVARSAGDVTVRITGRSPQVVPGFPMAVDAVAVGPVERFISEPSR